MCCTGVRQYMLMLQCFEQPAGHMANVSQPPIGCVIFGACFRVGRHAIPRCALFLPVGLIGAAAANNPRWQRLLKRLQNATVLSGSGIQCAMHVPCLKQACLNEPRGSQLMAALLGQSCVHSNSEEIMLFSTSMLKEGSIAAWGASTSCCWKALGGLGQCLFVCVLWLSPGPFHHGAWANTVMRGPPATVQSAVPTSNLHSGSLNASATMAWRLPCW